MAAISHICSFECPAKRMDEDLELLETIVWNDDDLTYGSIITVRTGPEEAISALTDDGIEELTDMLRDARVMTESWHEFRGTEPVTRIKAQTPR